MPNATLPLVISYYTPNTNYETLADTLRRSADRLGLDHRIEPRPARASWVENCAQKALFVRDMRRAEDRPILWVDADAHFVRRPTELEGLTTDVAILKREGWSFYGGQIYVGTGPQAHEFVERWALYCERYPHVWDQVLLGYAWWDMALEGRLRSHWLPETISAKQRRSPILRPLQRLWTPAALLHRQESRRSKRLQQPRPREFGTDDVPAWWREAAVLDRPFALNPDQTSALGLDP